MILEVESHEFWLPDPRNPQKSIGVYRVALGELIDGTQRKTFTPEWGNPDYNNKSGSIGYMDVEIGVESVPKIGARPLPRHSFQPGFYAKGDCEFIKALVIHDIAIEPQHRNQGYATYLKMRAEELARTWGLEAVVSPHLQSPIMRGVSRKRGYTFYEGGNKAVKRLEVS